MRAMKTAYSEAQGDPRGVALTWTVHPAAERPGHAMLAAVIIAALCVLVGLAVRYLGAAAVALAVLLLVLHRFFFSSRYEVDDEGVMLRTVLGTRRVAWRDVQRCEWGARGVWVSPRRRRTWREERGGMLILFGRHRDAVRPRLRECLAHVSGGSAAGVGGNPPTPTTDGANGAAGS
jgi:hypothetical protein